jgi:hypothetical protein
MDAAANQAILKQLEEKVLLKAEVFNKTKSVFDELKKILKQLSVELKQKVKNFSKENLIDYIETSEHEIHFTLADETLVFVLHSNIFTFDHTHEIWKNSYVEKDPNNSYCGKIFIYNFLTDSFRFNRTNDVGYIIARIFINREGHYFVEGKKQLGYLYNDFATEVLNEENLSKILNNAIRYSLDFDSFTPPFESLNEISVGAVIEAGVQARITTGKRLGFEFTNENKPII